MLKAIEIIEKTRLHLLQLIDALTIEQLNQIPAGFNNNIAWNICHLVSAQQGICYLRAGVPVAVEPAFQKKYAPETRPEAFITEQEIAEAKALLISTLQQLEVDYTAGVFNNYTPWVSRYGVGINNVDEAINFLPFHEGLHLGYVMAQKRALGL